MSIQTTNLVSKARIFAETIHRGEKRKSGRPYIDHPEGVADLIRETGGSDIDIAVAYLHDTIETGKTTKREIKEIFGAEIANDVGGLTDLPEWKGLPITERKRLQAERVKGESSRVKKIKLADATKNLEDLCDNPHVVENPEWVEGYIRGSWSIAAECRGVNTALDQRFNAVYQRVINVYSYS